MMISHLTAECVCLRSPCRTAMRLVGTGLVLAFVVLLALHVTSEPGTSIVSKTLAAQQHFVSNEQASPFMYVQPDFGLFCS